MPLVSISAKEATAIRKSNGVGDWKPRGFDDRVEPITKPHFYPSFKLKPGEKIFTIGSCFARNIEAELETRGFELPVRRLLQDPLFSDLDPGVLDNFGTPSIFNEVTWAFNPATPFVPGDHILQVAPDKFVDIHLTPRIAPTTLAVAVSRREAIRKLVRFAAECRVVIMTLGLAEVWFDTETGYYLNETVRPGLIRAYPNRFELHVLSFEEAFGYLEKALLILHDKNQHDLRVILTVSPIPLHTTHRRMDVIVANSYSKSMLRTVAETICSKYEWIDYYPSYESVMLSDRKLTWQDDLRHVRPEIVALNVGRMVDRYVGSSQDIESMRDQILKGGQAAAEELAQKASKWGGGGTMKFFREFASWSETSAVFAIEHARALLNRDRDDEAIRILNNAPAGENQFTKAVLEAQIQLRLHRAAEAIETLRPFIHDHLVSQDAWELLVRAYAENNNPDEAIIATHRYLEATGLARCWPLLNLARAFRDTHPDRAIYYFELIVDDLLDGDAWIQYEVADFLARHKRYGSARKMLSHLKPNSMDLKVRAWTLNLLLASTNGKPDE